MAIYDLFMEPLERRGLRRLRKKLVFKARGKVLEIGAGTGLNLDYYDSKKVSSLVMIDRDLNSRALEKKIKEYGNLNTALKEENVMSLSFPSESFDTVVFTLVFCTVADVEKGLKEIKRVLKKEGTIIFIEHVRPETEPLGSAFDTLTPLWKKLARGCHLNRNTEKTLKNMGFDLILEDKSIKNIFIGGRGKIKKTAL